MGLGGLEEVTEKAADEKAVMLLEEEREKRRKAFHYWEVAGREYKLKLTTGMIEKLENKYRTNVMTLISSDGIPPLSVMLTVVQAALAPWEHGVSYEDTKRLYDKWTEEGGNQMQLYTDVLMPVLAVSGFFTAKQAESILTNLKSLDDLM